MNEITFEIPVWTQKVLTGKNAVITGGTSGIGFAIADTFLNADCSNVLITSRNEERLSESLRKLREKHPEKAIHISGVILDLGKPDGFTDAFLKMREAMGDCRIDIWVNNAGIYQDTKFGTVSEEEWDRLMDTNLKAQYFLSQIIANYMIEEKIEGNILHICSSSSYRPSIDPYMLSKLGMSGLTLGMAKMLIPHGIVVNGIAPGRTFTPMLHKQEGDSILNTKTPAGRYILPQEIANLAVFLTSPMGRMIVGDVIKMTGGSAVTTYDDVRY